MQNIINRKIIKIDAKDQIAGRLASKVAMIVRGKNNPEFIPRIDGGDIVELSNIKEIKFTGKKLEQKKYFHHSGYPGGLKTRNLGDEFIKDPIRIFKKMVREMLPDVKFRNNMLRRIIIK
jgi:large subunit ribosomal protein L13